MEFEIVPSSPKALALKSQPKANTLYPFDALENGQSFTVKLEGANLPSLQAIASRKSKNGKQFRVLRHEDLQVVEVARIA